MRKSMSFAGPCPRCGNWNAEVETVSLPYDYVIRPGNDAEMYRQLLSVPGSSATRSISCVKCGLRDPERGALLISGGVAHY